MNTHKSAGIYFISLALLLISTSCENRLTKPDPPVKAPVSDFDSTVIYYKDKDVKLKMPGGIQCYMPFNKYALDSQKTMHNTFPKVYCYLNVSCPTCLVDISKWQEVSDEFVKRHIPVVLVLYGTDDFEYFKFLCESKKIKDFPYPFFLDTKDQFSILNPICIKFQAHRALLVDNKYRVVLQGSPLHSEKTMKIF